MDSLKHYGVIRRSGRYPWGSGGHIVDTRSFLGQVAELQKQGLTEVQIAEGFGITTTQLRARKSIARSDVRETDVAFAIRLKDKGYSNVAIGDKMGINESSVRALLDPKIQERSQVTNSTANMLKDQLKNKQYLDVGVGVEHHLGISRSKLKTALASLEEEGYTVTEILVDQLGTGDGKKTRVLVLGPEGTTYKDVVTQKEKIEMVGTYTEDGGRSYLGIKDPTSISGNRIHIRYDEDGGSKKDGVIELRPGVADLSLDNARYAQVRIAVDGKSYLKGMAMYSDDVPAGADVIFNTNKKRGTPPEDVFKDMKLDDDNPFGATVRQKEYTDKNGNKKLSALNIVNEEGDWNEWSKNLASQMLSKQSTTLAKQQLKLTLDSKQEELNDILSYTNPAVRKKLLDSYADGCDSAAVNLKAAAMPRQRSQVILPINDIKDTEIYAPNFRDGEKVALIRYPHGGTFEIPELTVNNRHKGANKVMHGAKDAVGISVNVAERMSGADFDGDTVLVIPTNGKVIKTTNPLKGLQNFDPKRSYPEVKNMKKMTSTGTQQEMGKISNLITDMTIKGANDSEIAAAVRHSMVVIDAEKHKLNYTKSALDNNIPSLKEKYQGKTNAGASTLISRASSEARVNDRKKGAKDPVTGRRVFVDSKTGEQLYTDTNESYVSKTGKTVYRQAKSTKMAEAKNAHDLSSGTKMESIYADHANKMKALANEARKASINTKTKPYSPSARKAYEQEERALKAKLNVALRNKPLERRAQLIANAVVKLKRDQNPDLTKAEIKRLNWQALNEARIRTGAKKNDIPITNKEWQAIQAGAITNNTLTAILNNTDLDQVKAYATPRTKKGLTGAKASKARNMLSRGYTQAEIADALGISLTTLQTVVD